MGLPVQITIHILWNIARGAFLVFRGINWMITGTHITVRKNYENTSYAKTAHVLTILARHKLDFVLQPSGPDNFMAVHSAFEEPEYVLSDHVSLYYVNKNEAVFVETDKGIDVSNSDYGAFYRIAQFTQAKKIIILPIHVFNKLGKAVGRTKAKIIFLLNTSRCGSTLVTQVFEQTGRAIAYSEPDALNALTQLRGALPSEEVDEIVVNVMNLLCKPIKDRQIDAYILKPCQPTMGDTPEIVRLFPDAYNVFLYRDGLKVSKSLARCAAQMPLLGILLIIGRTSPTLTKKMIIEMGLPSEQFERKVLSPIHFCSIVWAAAMRQYLDFREQDMKIVAVRYEDIAEDPVYSFHKMFEYCEMSFDAEAVERAMNRDSQRTSPLSMENLKRYKLEEFTEEVKKQTDEVCDSFQLPHFPDPYILPGTITQKE